MEKKLTEQESLIIINEMILEARNDFSSSYAKPMVFMGWATILVAILNIILLYMLPSPSYSYFAWLLMIPASIINNVLGAKREKEAKFTTHISKVISGVWSAYSVSLVVLLISIFSVVYIANSWQFAALIMPSILSFTGLALYATAVACRHKPYKTGAVLFWLGALMCVFLLLTPYFAALQFVVLILCMLLGFIQPSVQLRKE